MYIISSGINEMNNFITAGYLPCMTKTNCETCVEQTRFIPLKNNEIKFDNDTDYSSDSDASSSSDNLSEDDSKQRRRPKSTKYSIVAANISAYVANIKGL